jgi:hypothetical protein
LRRTDLLGQRVALVAQGKRGLLVRQGDVAAHELAVAQPGEKVFERGRCHVDRFVGALDTVGPQPVAVDHRRARVGNWVADDEGAFHVNRAAGAALQLGLDSTRRFESIPQSLSLGAGRHWREPG